MNIGPVYVFRIPPVLFWLDLENGKKFYFLSIDQYGSIDPLSHWLRPHCNSWCCIEFYWGYSRRYINFFKVRQANARTTIHDHTKDKESKISNVLQILCLSRFFGDWRERKKKIENIGSWNKNVVFWSSKQVSVWFQDFVICIIS